MLKGVLDAGITKNLIRIGSRSRVDERLAGFSLDTAGRSEAKSKLDRSVRTADKEMRSTEKEMDDLIKHVSLRRIPQERMETYIQSTYPSHYKELVENIPSWISTLYMQFGEEPDDDDDGPWETVGKARNGLSIVEFWATGQDLLFLKAPDNKSARVDRDFHNVVASFNKFNILSNAETENPKNSRQGMFNLNSAR